MSEFQYQRLTRSGMRTVSSRGSLWLGSDHLLSAESNGYRETYKRFYFSDIQAIIVQHTKLRVIWNAILPTPLAGGCLGLLACLTSGARNEGAIIAWLIFIVVILLFLVINNILGTGCVCYLRTAVQIEQLPGLYRAPKARKVLSQIRPLIAAAQGGELSAETVAARMQEWSVSSGAAPAKTVEDEPDVPPRLNP